MINSLIFYAALLAANPAPTPQAELVDISHMAQDLSTTLVIGSELEFTTDFIIASNQSTNLYHTIDQRHYRHFTPIYFQFSYDRETYVRRIKRGTVFTVVGRLPTKAGDEYYWHVQSKDGFKMSLRCWKLKPYNQKYVHPQPNPIIASKLSPWCYEVRQLLIVRVPMVPIK